MRKIRIASVTLLIFRNMKIYVMVDTFHHVCKFYVGYHKGVTDELKSEVFSKVSDFAYSFFPSNEIELTVSETSKDDVFNYLPSKFCNYE